MSWGEANRMFERFETGNQTEQDGVACVGVFAELMGYLLSQLKHSAHPIPGWAHRVLDRGLGYTRRERSGE